MNRDWTNLEREVKWHVKFNDLKRTFVDDPGGFGKTHSSTVITVEYDTEKDICRVSVTL